MDQLHSPAPALAPAPGTSYITPAPDICRDPVSVSLSPFPLPPSASGGPICALLGQTCEFKLIRQVAWGAIRPNGSYIHIVGLVWGSASDWIGSDRTGIDLLHRLVVFWCCHLSFDLLLIACCLSPLSPSSL